MIPTLVIVGRPNVGKSTIFNRLTHSRDALVADMPGVTRDRVVGFAREEDRSFIVVDTGGLTDSGDPLQSAIARQALGAAASADRILFVVDGREGLTGADRQIGEALRPLGRPVIVVVNKTEALDPELACAEFHALGLGNPLPISSAHNRGLSTLLDTAFAGLDAEAASNADGDRIRVTVIGRPNVGKSTLVNRMLGEERVLVADAPGTTRDRIAIDFERDGVGYTLIDTAGVRRRARVQEHLEKLAVIKTLEALAQAQVAILVIDAREGVTEQDASLAGRVIERGAALIIALNKWDGMEPEDRRRARAEAERRLDFAHWAPMTTISALHGTGVGDLYPLIRAAHRSALVQAPPSRLTAILEHAVTQHQPPLVKGRRVKLRYAHMGGHSPPRIVIHGSQVAQLPASYQRYLEKVYREALELTGTPLRIELRQGENPYANKRNPLSRRQVDKRRRLMRHAKK
ncbi:MAG: ribosome biogenesis GTPase Der [Gammaproteobacteria bacterium]